MARSSRPYVYLALEVEQNAKLCKDFRLTTMIRLHELAEYKVHVWNLLVTLGKYFAQNSRTMAITLLLVQWIGRLVSQPVYELRTCAK